MNGKKQGFEFRPSGDTIQFGEFFGVGLSFAKFFAIDNAEESFPFTKKSGDLRMRVISFERGIKRAYKFSGYLATWPKIARQCLGRERFARQRPEIE